LIGVWEAEPDRRVGRFGVVGGTKDGTKIGCLNTSDVERNGFSSVKVNVRDENFSFAGQEPQHS
jgi:hypothetical protein